jgi:hypothetical protein
LDKTGGKGKLMLVVDAGHYPGVIGHVMAFFLVKKEEFIGLTNELLLSFGIIGITGKSVAFRPLQFLRQFLLERPVVVQARKTSVVARSAISEWRAMVKKA